MAVQRRVTVELIMNLVSERYNVTILDMKYTRREPHLFRARHMAMWLARNHTRHSFPTIGRIMQRDHSTIIHGVNAIDKARQTEPGLDDEIDWFEAELSRITGTVVTHQTETERLTQLSHALLCACWMAARSINRDVPSAVQATIPMSRQIDPEKPRPFVPRKFSVPPVLAGEG